MNTTTSPTTAEPVRPQLVAVKPKIDALTKMREAFPSNQISLLPKPYKKDSERGLCPVCHTYHGLPAAHLDYVGHAAITLRLLEADPLWSWEPMAVTPEGLPAFDKDGCLWIKLTVGGVTRIGFGSAVAKANQEVGARVKEVIGDALRNGSMRFGAALELWHKGDLYGPDGRADLDQIDDDGVITNRPTDDGNPNGAAPAEQRTPSAPPPGRKSAVAAKKPVAASAAAGAQSAADGISEGQMKNLLVKVKSLDMTDDMVVAMLDRIGVRGINTAMSLADWKKVKAELDAAARLV